MLHRCAALVGAIGLVFTVACSQTDAGISTNVKTKLAADDTVKAYKVDVDTHNGVVTLSGDVETAAAKEQAIQIARTTEGVRDVIDQIRINEAAATAGRDDDDVDVDDKLEGQVRRGASEAREEGREAADKSRELGHDAKREAGEAADSAKDATAKAGRAMTDAAITSAVKAKFVADTTVKALKIDVDTHNGVVTLNGTVSSRAEADKAMMIARNTDGVKRVVDNMKVGRY